MPRPKGSKNQVKSTTQSTDFDTLIAEESSSQEALVADIACVRRLQKSPQPVKLSSGSAEIEQWDRPD